MDINHHRKVDFDAHPVPKNNNNQKKNKNKGRKKNETTEKHKYLVCLMGILFMLLSHYVSET